MFVGVGLRLSRTRLGLTVGTPATSVALTDAFVVIGDSWTVDYGGYYAGYYKEQRPALDIVNQGVGGSGVDSLAQPARRAAVVAERPRALHIGIGRNDLYATYLYATVQDWIDALAAEIAYYKAQLPGVKIQLETLAARQVPTEPVANAEHNARRGDANAWMRQQLADGAVASLVDFAADSRLGDDADMIPAAAGPTTISVDGLHLHDREGASSGHDIASEIFAAATDTLLGYAVTAPVPLPPTIARTGTSGAAPFKWSMTINQGGDDTVFPGYYWWVQRASNDAFTAELDEAVQPITPTDMAEGVEVGFPDLGATPGGPLRLRVAVLRESDFVDGELPAAPPGGWSNVLSDTIDLSAGAATTEWGLGVNTDHSQYITLTETATGNGDWRIAQGTPFHGVWMWARVDQPRSAPHFVEFIIEERATYILAFGIVGATGDTLPVPPVYDIPSDFSGTGFEAGRPTDAATGDRIVMEVIPASAEGVNDGVIRFYKNGVRTSADDDRTHSHASYRPVFGCQHGVRVRLNTGQEAFGFNPATPGVTRYN